MTAELWITLATALGALLWAAATWLKADAALKEAQAARAKAEQTEATLGGILGAMPAPPAPDEA
jgi:hypothetical protein